MQLNGREVVSMHKSLDSIPCITRPLEWVRQVHLKTLSTWQRRKGHGGGKSCWNAYQPCSSASLSCPPTVTASSQGCFMLLQGRKANWVCSPNKPWSLFGSRYQSQIVSRSLPGPTEFIIDTLDFVKKHVRYLNFVGPHAEPICRSAYFKSKLGHIHSVLDSLSFICT